MTRFWLMSHASACMQTMLEATAFLHCAHCCHPLCSEAACVHAGLCKVSQLLPSVKKSMGCQRWCWHAVQPAEAKLAADDVNNDSPLCQAEQV